MTKYVALFRGINVGGKNILPMKDLVTALAEAGCSQVQTYIQSGNAVFDWRGKRPQTLVKKLQASILSRHGFSPDILVMTAAELERAIENNPYETSEGKTLHFFFLTSTADAHGLVALAALKSESEQFSLCGNVFYLYAPDGIGRSKLVAKVDKQLKASTTARNWNTIQQLMAMVKN
jgi:uncharacterized protein (DUF1697 family)